MTLPIRIGYRAKVGASRSPRRHAGAMLDEVRAALQLSIDDVMNERNIVDDGEMGAFADMDLKA